MLWAWSDKFSFYGRGGSGGGPEGSQKDDYCVAKLKFACEVEDSDLVRREPGVMAHCESLIDLRRDDQCQSKVRLISSASDVPCKPLLASAIVSTDSVADIENENYAFREDWDCVV